MPIIKSAKKRMRQESVRRSRNSITKKALKQSVKDLESALNSGDKKATEAGLKKVYSTFDTAVKKNLIHKNKAARKKSELNAKVKASLGTKKSTTSTKKPAAKKAATKKTTAKKTSKTTK